jgi:hypothetical protein
MKRISLVLGVVALLAASVAAAMASSASATTIMRETITAPFSETDIPHDCRPGVTGTLQATDVFSYQSVETAEGFHIAGTITDSGRIDWSDGTYTIIGFTDHVSFTAARAGTTVFTNAHEDSGDTYAADGAFLYRGTFHVVERMTVTDGVVTVEFERGHFHFFGAAPSTCP